ncbi:hypothetical protein QBC36DRAFT_354433 [Triangularia setosa]|uniref:Uncharacterized protein n=1 Tax=Triangularia setosa TaxID=2587417 RepID=A0AAN6WEF9_9PEZI|nr:hypothetical protein QBC36DRAFT_354433 [Podospora setosa]
MSLDKENIAKTPEELAQELEEQAVIQQAMMADLGIGRVNDLAVDDGELEAMKAANKAKKCGTKKGRPDHGDHQPRVEYRCRALNESAAVVARCTNMATVWKDAVASGVFDDDDAAAVKGLDDLGGPRLHERKADARVKATALINFQKRQNNNLHPYAMQSQMPPSKKPRHSSSHIHQTVKSGTPFGGHHNRNQNASSSKMTGSSRQSSAPIPPSYSTSKHVQGPPRIVQQRLEIISIPPSQYGGNQKIASPPNMVARAEVLVTPPGNKRPMPSIVFLTVAGAPTLGLFMVFVENKLFIQFTISEYQDFMSSDVTLSLHFGENVLFFSLTFRTAAELEVFLKVLRELKAGKYSVRALESSTKKPVAEMLVAPKTSGVPVKTAPPDAAPAKPVARLPPPTAQAVTPAPKAMQYATRMLAGEGSSRCQLDDHHNVESPQGVLISLDGKDTSPVSKRCSSEVPALVPHAHNISRASTPTQNDALTLEPFKLSVPDAVAMLRNMLTAFIMKKAGGKTKQELAATVEGIREAFMDVVCQDHTGSERQEVVAQIEDYLNSSAATSGEHRRLQYTKEEMFEMFDNQVQPPAWLANLPYLPPRTKSRQSPRLEDPLYTPPVDDVVTKKNICKSTMGMDWVLRKAEFSATTNRGQPVAVITRESSMAASPKQPESEKSKKTILLQPSTATLQPVQVPVKPMDEPRKPDVGLQASRWSSGMAAPIQNINAFTGLPYENRWKKGSYLFDLAQLDPQTKVDRPVDDLVDYFLPTSQAGGKAGAFPTLQSSASDLSSDAQVGDLGRQMSRLSLNSPAGSRATSCSTVRREPIEQVSQLIPIEEDPATPPLNAAAQTFTPTARAAVPATSTPPPANLNTPPSTSALRGLEASRHASRAALPTTG